jgi:proton glutamate symport protein
VILGVDALMDMARTSVNLVGNCLATAVMARWEGELGAQPMLAAERSAELAAQEHLADRPRTVSAHGGD